MGDRPEKDGADRVEAETHDDGLLVSKPAEDDGGDGREGEVSNSEVGDL